MLLAIHALYENTKQLEFLAPTRAVALAVLGMDQIRLVSFKDICIGCGVLRYGSCDLLVESIGHCFLSNQRMYNNVSYLLRLLYSYRNRILTAFLDQTLFSPDIGKH